MANLGPDQRPEGWNPVPRAYDKIIDDVNTSPLGNLQRPEEPSRVFRVLVRIRTGNASIRRCQRRCGTSAAFCPLRPKQLRLATARPCAQRTG